MFSDWGMQRGPPQADWGYPCRGTVHCALKVPQDWGIKGVEKTFVIALKTILLTYKSPDSRMQV